ncbi:hypothetical protein DRN67_02325 [Candidatus Micrarchaeota archaeon]|nr:MAG: hypothetical protein DRN67_02325 [Candidatus Micrarchaeota archaeon]
MRALLILLLLGVMLGCAQQEPYARMPDGARIGLEVAYSTQEHAQGLSGRENLCEECGMLFVYADSDERGFWMYEMQFPIDMIFIDEKGGVVDVAYQMQPCESECIVYHSKGSAKYVLEVNAGYAQEHGVQKGESIELHY